MMLYMLRVIQSRIGTTLFFFLVLLLAAQSAKSLSSPSSTTARQSIAVIGTGAVGGYYGARLWEAGHTVHFFLREPHYSTGMENGGCLRVTSVDGDIECRGDMHASVHDIPTPVDWILVALKSSSLAAIPDLVEPLLSPSTRILVVMNGIIEDDLLDMFRKTKNTEFACLYGGMAFICCNRVAPAHVDHSHFGLLSAGVAWSQNQAGDDHHKEDLQAFEQLFQDSIVPVSTEPNLLRGRWKKMIWNLPFNGLSVAMGGITVDKIVNDPGLRALARNIMEETVAAANAELQYEEPLLGEAEMAAMMKLSDDMGPYKPSTMLDFMNRQPMEVAYLFREPLKRATRLGIHTPTLDTIVTQIEAYQRMHNLF